MEINKILHMKEGDGELSYARNSTLQGKILTQLSIPLVESAISSLLSNNNGHSLEVLNVADFGCGVGPSPVALTSSIIHAVDDISTEIYSDIDQVPKLQIYMNDLPSNDFNLLLSDLWHIIKLSKKVGMRLCDVMGIIGSYHNQLFPHNYLHLVHSNYALHWLSQVPPEIYNEEGISKNKGNLIESETSPPEVVKAYRAQFRQDFGQFLQCRSNEVVTNGYMVLTLVGNKSMVPQHVCTATLVSQAIYNLVSKGLIVKEIADSFDLPLHYPRKEEIRSVIEEEGSFAIERMESRVDNWGEEIKDIKAKAKSVVKGIRAAIEALVSFHFGEEICDALFSELAHVTLSHLEKKPVDLLNIVVMLRKI